MRFNGGKQITRTALSISLGELLAGVVIACVLLSLAKAISYSSGYYEDDVASLFRSLWHVASFTLSLILFLMQCNRNESSEVTLRNKLGFIPVPATLTCLGLLHCTHDCGAYRFTLWLVTSAALLVVLFIFVFYRGTNIIYKFTGAGCVVILLDYLNFQSLFCYDIIRDTVYDLHSRFVPMYLTIVLLFFFQVIYFSFSRSPDRAIPFIPMVPMIFFSIGVLAELTYEQYFLFVP